MSELLLKYIKSDGMSFNEELYQMSKKKSKIPQIIPHYYDIDEIKINKTKKRH
jgi:hypothetical protein